MPKITHGGGTERRERVGRLKCRACTSAAFLWAGANLILVPLIGDYTTPKQMFTEPTFWSIAAASPAVLLALLACYYRFTERPTRYEVELPVDQDPRKLH